MAQRVVWLHSACMKLVDVKLSGIRTVRQSVLLVSNLVFAIVWFTWVVTLLAMGAGTAITVVGVPLLALTVRSGRAVGSFERRRLLTFTGSTLQPLGRRRCRLGSGHGFVSPSKTGLAGRDSHTAS